MSRKHVDKHMYDMITHHDTTFDQVLGEARALWFPHQLRATSTSQSLGTSSMVQTALVKRDRDHS